MTSFDLPMGVSILDPIEWGHPFSQDDLVLAVSSFRSIGARVIN